MKVSLIERLQWPGIERQSTNNEGFNIPS